MMENHEGSHKQYLFWDMVAQLPRALGGGGLKDLATMTENHIFRPPYDGFLWKVDQFALRSIFVPFT